MASTLGEEAGKRASWSSTYESNRPRDILGLTKAQEEKISQFIGFVGKDQSENEQKTFVLIYNGTTAPTLTDFAATPIGTIIIAPKLNAPKIYIHKTKSTIPAVSDWYSFTASQET
ncbi:MAG: hypothetical protein QXD05_00230 [Candidatus Pacearchaeota archaeon]